MTLIPNEEDRLASVLKTFPTWCCPVDQYELRMWRKFILDKAG